MLDQPSASVHKALEARVDMEVLVGQQMGNSHILFLRVGIS
jgi:hypothetical protein